MRYSTNETHNPNLQSWVLSARSRATEFPIQNLPFGVFKRRGRPGVPRVGVAIGDRILDIAECRRAGLFEGMADRAAQSCLSPSLNDLMALGPDYWSALRLRLSRLLRTACPDIQKNSSLAEKALVPMEEAQLQVPVEIGDYTDFYASIYHAQNAGRLFRPDNPLLPNYKHLPIAYHGRASSIVVSGTTVCRPQGQSIASSPDSPGYGPSGSLDYEMEVGFFIGPGNVLGEPVALADAESQIFGLCLVNDWSARDIQRWEYQPLGPFLGKSFATTISPWVLSIEALAPFRVPAFRRDEADPSPLPYLCSQENSERGGVDLFLEVYLQTPDMRRRGLDRHRLSRGRFRDVYWTIAQMLAHHTSNGCNLRTGDMLASGTVSGAQRESWGCLAELTQGGQQSLTLPNGETRKFLQDGDEVIFRGWCEREGFAPIGFGECRGRVIDTFDR